MLEITTTTTSTAAKERGLCRGSFVCSPPHTQPAPSAAALPPSSRLAVIRPCLVVQLGLGHGTRQVVARAEGEALLEARDVRGLPPVPRRAWAVLGTGAAVLVEDAPADRVLLRRWLEVPGKRTLGALQGGFAKGRLRARLKARLRARRGHVQGRGHGEGMARRGASCQAAQTRAGVRGRGRAIGLGLGLRLGALPLVRVVARRARALQGGRG